MLSCKILTPDDTKYIIEHSHANSKKGAKNMKKCAKEVYRGMFPLLPEELINIQENFSGVQHTNELRKRLPGIIPTRLQEMEAKHKMSKEFMAVMLPKRISTGWTVDASRLLEVLQFKYSFIEGTIFAKLQGDGRLVGGRHSTYIGLNLLNHDLKLRGMSYQNPRNIYPLSIFYESDSRDNLEKNIGEQNSLKDITTAAGANTKLFLGGDEMFLEAILDGSSVLGPTTNTGWNIYDECDQGHKKEVAASGFRTDLRMPLNREHTETLLPNIPIKRTVFCILHGLARIVEKLLMLEVEGIISTVNKGSQTKSGMTVEDIVHNLESNINKRGVRQGNFHVPIDKSGKPEKISLNKDHALVIISPPPVGTEREYPHVLTNVVPDTIMANTLPHTVKQYLKIEHDFTELLCVKMIWQSVYEMFTILQKEPAHTLQESAMEGSVKPSDYSFSYSDEQLKTYKFHAERLYQLFCLRYTFRNLTPYVLKFVDYGIHFMTNLGIPLCRFSTEGGEHMNYSHNCFYYQHTTRNGGKDSNHDPNFAILLSSWRNLHYDISKGDVDVAAAFQTYVQKHVWAAMLQRKLRKCLFKATCRKIGIANPTSTLDGEAKKEKLIELQSIVSRRMHVPQVKQLFEGRSYILCGNAPKYSGGKMTQESVTNLIKEKGGQVKKKLPGITKGRSTKQYSLLVNIKPGTKLPRVVTGAIRRGFSVVDYSFVYESVDKRTLQDLTQYVPPPVANIVRSVNVMPSLYHKHFKKRAKMVTFLKKRRKLRSSTEKRVKAPKNLAIFYAIVKRREFVKKKKMSFANSAKLFGQFSKDSRKLPQAERTRYFEMWQKLKQQQKTQAETAANLAAYNSTENPNYSKVVTSMNSTASNI